MGAAASMAIGTHAILSVTAKNDDIEKNMYTEGKDYNNYANRIANQTRPGGSQTEPANDETKDLKRVPNVADYEES